MLARIVFILSIMFICVSNAVAGPLGLEMGMSLKEIAGKKEKLGQGLYKISNVPKPHSAFESYIIKIAPKSGLCIVKAMGKDIRTNSFGGKIRDAFNEMENKLESSYGVDHLSLDFLVSESVWNEPDEWMTGLLKEERKLYSEWGRIIWGSSLPDTINNIMLDTHAISQNKGYITVQYNFSNYEACEDELSFEDDKAL